MKTVSNEIQPNSQYDKTSKIGKMKNEKDPSQNEVSTKSNEELEANNRYECRSCGYVYEPSDGIRKLGIPKGTSFLDIDAATFRCPVCRVGLDSYQNIGPRSKASGFEENLTYGFGVNKLPSGQKNVLIFGGLAFAAACFLSLYSLH